MSIDLTLHRIKELASRFEDYSRPTVHVAGTNGKGSVSALLTRIFLAPGISVGRFSSPHLITVSDSISINDSPIQESLFETVIAEVRAVNEQQNIHASSFEVLTLTALLIFERAKMDVVICEVGMGGRLDATNIIPDSCIVASVITSIDLDHQAFLGSTIEDITREKAGIIRRSRPVVLAPQKQHGVGEVVRTVAKSRCAHLTLAPTATDRNWDEEIDGPSPPPFSLNPFSPPPSRPVEIFFPEMTYKLLLPLHGDHQLENLGTAIALYNALYFGDAQQDNYFSVIIGSIGAESLREAVRGCLWPGRLSFHVLSPNPSTSSPLRLARAVPIVADGAHNPAASQTLMSYIVDLLASLRSKERRRSISLTYILALSHSPPKTPASVLLPLIALAPLLLGYPEIDLKTNVAFVRFSPPAGMPWVKSVAPSVMAEIAQSVNDSMGEETQNRLTIWTPPNDSAKVAEDWDGKAELKLALAWAADQNASLGADGEPRDGLVVVAGSLYLVADLYRILGTGQEI